MLMLIRHGKPRKSGIILGQIDDSLDPLIFGRKFTNVDDYFDFSDAVVISSPLRRAKETASLFGFDDCIIDDRVSEINLGEFQGMDLTQYSMNLVMNLEEKPDDNSHNGETYNEFYDRVKSFFDEYKDDKRKIIVFTHSGVIRLILIKILKMQHKKFLPKYLEIFEIDEEYKSYNSHQTNVTVT